MPTIKKKKYMGGKKQARDVPPQQCEANHALTAQAMLERLREKELEVRQCIISEEQRVRKDALSRESNMRSAVLENELRAVYEEMKKDLIESLTQREWDLQNVQSKLTGMEKAQEFLMRQKQDALQLVTNLQDQLEAARKFFSAERELLKGRIEQLEKDGKLMEKELQEEKMRRNKLEQIDRLEHRYAETSSNHLVASHPPESRRSSCGTDASEDDEFEPNEEETETVEIVEMDKETQALVAVLKAEAELYKEQVANLQKKVNDKTHDEERTSLLVAVLNTQLESVREENKHLYETAQKRVEVVENMQNLLQSERDKYFGLLKKAEHASSEACLKQTQQKLELEVHQKQVVELTSRLEKVSGELNALHHKHEEYVTNAMKREQDDCRANAAMKTTLDKYEMEKEQLMERNKKAQEDLLNYKALTRAEMDSLKKRLRSLQEIFEQKEREHTKAAQVLSSENEQIKLERDRLWTTYQTELQGLQNKEQSLLKERDTLAKELKLLQKSSSDTQKELYENLVLMTACHDAKKDELERQQTNSKEKDKEYTSNMVFLRAENENLKSKMAEMAVSSEQRDKEHLERVNDLERQVAELNSKIAVEHIQRDDTLAKTTHRADLAERNVRRLQNQLHEAQEKLHKKEMESVEAAKALRADARELKSELDLAKRTIERLEGDIGDRSNYKHLASINENLSAEVMNYRAQVDHLKNQLFAINSEGPLIKEQEYKKLVEEREKLKERTEGLERAQALLLPLLSELRSHLQGSVVGLPTGLRAALQKYDSAITNAIRLRDCPTCGQPLLLTTTAVDSAAAPNDSRVSTFGDEACRTLPTVLDPRPPSGAAAPPGKDIYTSILSKKDGRAAQPSSWCGLPRINVS